MSSTIKAASILITWTNPFSAWRYCIHPCTATVSSVNCCRRPVAVIKCCGMPVSYGLSCAFPLVVGNNAICKWSDEPWRAPSVFHINSNHLKFCREKEAEKRTQIDLETHVNRGEVASVGTLMFSYDKREESKNFKRSFLVSRTATTTSKITSKATGSFFKKLYEKKGKLWFPRS